VLILAGGIIGGYWLRVRSVEARSRRLEAQVASRTRHLAALNAVAAVTSQSLHIQETLTGALDKTLEVTGLEAGGIYLLKADGQHLTLRVHRGLDQALVQAIDNLKVGEGFSGRVIQTGETLIVRDIATDARLTRLAVSEMGFRALAVVPLAARGNVLGTMFLMTRRDRAFSQQEIELLASTGRQIGMAVENARLYEQASSRLAQLAAMQETNRALVSTHELDVLLEMIVQQAATLLNADGGILNLADWDKREDEVVARAGSIPNVLGERAPLDGGLSGWVTLHKQPVMLSQVREDPRVDPRVLERFSGLPLRSAAAAPLMVKDQAIGTLVLVDKLGGDGEFDPADLALLVSFADQAATAIENARLYSAEKRRAEEFKAISEVERHIASVLDPDELLAQVAGSIREAFDYYLVEIALVEGDELVFKARAARNGEAPFQSYRVKVGQEGVTGWVAAVGEPLRVPDVSREPRFVKVTQHATRSELAVPIKTKGKVIGVLNVQSDELEAFEEGDVAILQQLANQASVAIENARLFAQEQHRAEQFRVIAEVGRRFALTLEIAELLEQVVRLIQEAFDYYHVGIGLIEGDEVVYRVGAGALWDDPQFQFRPGRLKVGQEGLTGWVAGHGQPVLAQDVSQEPRYVWMQGSRTRSELVMPIIAKGRTIGVLDVQSDRLNAFDDKDVNVLQSLAHQAGAAIENARLYAAEQRRVEQFRVLTEVSQRIASILDIDELLAQVVRLIQRAFGYHYVDIGLIEGDELVFRVGAGEVWDTPPFQAKPSRLKVGKEGVSGWVAETGEAHVAPDVSREPRYIPVEGSRARSELTIPILIKGKVIGVLDIESDRLNDFDDTDLDLMTSLANQTGVAIENARLYEQAQQMAVSEERNRLARDLHDSVTQSLYGITLYAQAAAGHLAAGRMDKLAGHLRELQETSQDALAEMRLLIFELRPPVLTEEGLVAALQSRLSAVEGRAGVKTEFRSEMQGRLPLVVEEGLYRIAQEALNNCLKHAHARRIVVTVRRDNHTATLTIADDGVGFDPTTVRERGGLGLSDMEERAAQLGARLSVSSKPGEGTQVCVEVCV
jgi:GAF domain-containing protein